jgi:glycosyltransferase involved in cell wall biosynthesis
MTILNESAIPLSSALACAETAGMVSTVTTSYNKGPYLAEAIDSALAQDYPYQEILVIDDGSTDHTPDVAGAYQDQIRYIRQENRGPSGAKNRGVLEARGEFIAFLDGDDRWRPGKLSKQIKCLRRNPAAALIYTDRLVLRDGAIVSPSLRMEGKHLYRGRVLDQLLMEMLIPFSSTVVRRKCLIEVGLFDERRRAADDYDLWLRIGRLYEMDYVDEVLLEYRAESEGSIGARLGNLFQITMDIQNTFIREYYNGRYTNPRAVAVGNANRYSVWGDYHLAHDRRLRALGAHLCALRHDWSSSRRFFNVLRSVIPNRWAAVLKKAIGRKGPTEHNRPEFSA